MSEHDEQVKVMQWAGLKEFRYPELGLLHAIPNGAKLPWRRNRNGRRFSPEASKLKAEGLKAGVPDMSLPVARQGYHGLYVELKAGSNQPTDEQVWWLDRLAAQGFLAVVCRGAEDAIETIAEYLGIRSDL